MFVHGGAWVEAFTLPSLTSPTLSQSHSGHFPFWFTNMTLLRSYMPSPEHDWTQKFDILVHNGNITDLGNDQAELSFLCLILLRDGTISMEVSNSRRFEFSIFSLRSSLCRGVARGISCVQSRPALTKVYGYTITEDRDQRGSILHSELSELVGTTPGAFDGIGGRLCFCHDSWPLASIEIHDYV